MVFPEVTSKSVQFTMLVVALLGAGHAMGAASIVQNGRSNAEIVIAAKPTRMQKFAAQELQEYIRKITGAETPVTAAPTGKAVKIYVGKSVRTDKLGLKNEDLDYGAYRMASGENWLALFGRDTNYFMDKPGDAGPEFPSRRGERKRAAKAWEKKHGKMWSSPFMSSFKGYNKKLGLWATDEHGSLNAVNDFLRSLGVRWYMPGDFGQVLPKMKTLALPKVNKTVRPEWGQRYMMFYFNAPFMATPDEFKWQLRLGFYPDASIFGGHGTLYLLGTPTVKKQHPEFFAKYGASRATGGQGKPCYSSEGLFRSAMGFADLMYTKYNYDVVSFMPTDGYTSFCQCDLCKGKDTPERGFKGMMSDYVWSFMNRAAAEVAKTHPGKQILCYAYNTYLEPPKNIERFHPNLQVGICHHRDSFHNPAQKKKWLEMRDGFLKKIPSGKIRLWEYYKVLGGVPGYYPHIIAEDMKALKGKINGTMIEVARGRVKGRNLSPDPLLATNHLNLWLTARLWWDPDRDVDAMLEEYYANFYGPAAPEMKRFIEYSEKNWPLMRSQADPIDEAFKLIAAARKAAGENNIYAGRIQLVVDYMEPLKTIREHLKIGRSENPVCLFAERDRAGVKIDGKLDDAFWKDLKTYKFKELKDGGETKNDTTFKAAWAGDSLYFGLRCEDADMANLTVFATRDGDQTMFNGDSVELLIETPAHCYYQIAIDPNGYLNDLSRVGAAVGKKGKITTKWQAGIERAVFRGKDAWTMEIRVPALGPQQKDILPDFGVAGDKPSKQTPWYFNLCRVRRRGESVEFSAFSPTHGSGFHDIMKFAKLAPK